MARLGARALTVSWSLKQKSASAAAGSSFGIVGHLADQIATANNGSTGDVRLRGGDSLARS